MRWPKLTVTSVLPATRIRRLLLTLGICFVVAYTLFAGWRWLTRPFNRNDFCCLRDQRWKAKPSLSRRDVVDVLGRPSEEARSMLNGPMGLRPVSIAQWRSSEVRVFAMFDPAGTVIALESPDVPPAVSYQEPSWPQRAKDWLTATWRRWVR